MKGCGIIAGLAIAACTPAVQQTADSACQVVTFENASFTDCIATSQHNRIRLVIDPSVRDLPALARSMESTNRQVSFAMNGGMYDDAGPPIGLAISDGRQVHPLNRKSGAGNFHLLPNGVFSVENDGWHVRTTDAYAALRKAGPEVATQSGPMLVIAGTLHPQIAADGPSRYVRNAVGIDASGKAHFIISDQPVSFGVMARLFRDRLGCPDALYLDGSVSALWDPARGRIDSTVPLGPLLVVEKI